MAAGPVTKPRQPDVRYAMSTTRRQAKARAVPRAANSDTVPRKEIIGADATPPADTPKLRHNRRSYIEYVQARQAGGSTTVRQETGARAWNEYVEEYRRERCLRAVPKKTYLAMAGRPARTVNDQGDRLEIPMGGKTVNMYDVVRGFHDFLAQNKNVLRNAGKDDTNGEPQTKYTELLREEHWRIAQLKRREMERDLLSRVEVRESLLAFSTLMRTSIDTMQRNCGSAAVDIMDTLLSDWTALITSWNTEVENPIAIYTEVE